MNKGDLFDKIKYNASFNQMAENDASTKDLESVTGEKFGTNEILKMEDIVSPAEGG